MRRPVPVHPLANTKPLLDGNREDNTYKVAKDLFRCGATSISFTKGSSIEEYDDTAKANPSLCESQPSSNCRLRYRVEPVPRHC
jgi:hypothetical protein